MITFVVEESDRRGAIADEGLASSIIKKLRLRDMPLFYLIVVLPTLLAALYLLFIASPIYVSEARFFVRSSNTAQAASGLNFVLQNVGLGQAETDSFAVHEYIMSRDAMADLVQHHNLSAILSRPGADFLSRFPHPFQPTSMESLFRAYPRFVKVTYDATTGISTLEVKAFRPDDAHSVAQALLNDGEGVINQLNAQAQHDAVTEATREVSEDEIRVAIAQQNLTSFRNHAQLIDPDRASAMNSELVGKLSLDQATLRAERGGLAAAAPASPQLSSLDSRINAYTNEIAAQQSKIAGETGSLAPKIATYEQLTLEREFADRSLASALTSLESSQIDARRKRLYLERVVSPSTPDRATEPRRFESLALVLVSALLAYGTVLLVLSGFREHNQV